MIELVSDIVYCITAVRQPLLKENLGFFYFYAIQFLPAYALIATVPLFSFT